MSRLELEELGLASARGVLARIGSPFAATRFHTYVDDLGGHLYMTPTSGDVSTPPERAQLVALAKEIGARLPYALITPVFRVTAELLDEEGISCWSVTAGVRLYVDAPSSVLPLRGAETMIELDDPDGYLIAIVRAGKTADARGGEAR